VVNLSTYYSMDSECCVCKSVGEVVSVQYTHCPSCHSICKECFLSVLTVSQGQPVYRCPLCRSKYMFSGQEMNEMLMTLVDDNGLCMRVQEDNTVVKKCQFENCGCRINVVDIITPEDMDLTIQKLIGAADHY